MSLVNNGYFHADSAIVRQSVAEGFVSIAAQAEVTQSQCAAVKLKLQPSRHEELSHHEAESDCWHNPQYYDSGV